MDLPASGNGADHAHRVEEHRDERADIAQWILAYELGNLAGLTIEAETLVQRIAVNAGEIDLRRWPMRLPEVSARARRDQNWAARHDVVADRGRTDGQEAGEHQQ